MNNSLLVRIGTFCKKCKAARFKVHIVFAFQILVYLMVNFIDRQFLQLLSREPWIRKVECCGSLLSLWQHLGLIIHLMTKIARIHREYRGVFLLVESSRTDWLSLCLPLTFSCQKFLNFLRLVVQHDGSMVQKFLIYRAFCDCALACLIASRSWNYFDVERRWHYRRVYGTHSAGRL